MNKKIPFMPVNGLPDTGYFRMDSILPDTAYAVYYYRPTIRCLTGLQFQNPELISMLNTLGWPLYEKTKFDKVKTEPLKWFHFIKKLCA